ncbi:MAG: LLM class F420-dependent oxidoreductase [Chloroflexi bacterium]|nr:MAG: LLM class F420-dependent oxidoreductase [Chloroflexota bacterium]
MKYGFVFPQYELPPDPIAIRDYVQAAENLGYDYLLTYEHVLGANPNRAGGWHGPYTYQHAFHEPFVLFGYLAGLTQKLEFVTGILILPQRQTALVAKQAAEVDVLSNGRLRLGIGVGWNKVEYDALGQNFTTRGKRSEEQVDLLRRLWTEPLVTFNGEFDHIEDAGLNPLPIQRPIPIWFGGGADIVLQRIARLGDGWLPNTMPLDSAKQLTDKLNIYLEEAERTRDNFGIDVRLNISSQNQSTWETYIQTWRDLGMTHLCVNPLHAGLDTVDKQINQLRTFKDFIGW